MAVPSALLGGPEPLVLLLLALALDVQLGDWASVARLTGQPAGMVRRAVRAADHRLNRMQRSPAVRRVRGTLAALVLLVPAALLGWLGAMVARDLPYGWLVELFVLLAALGTRRSWSSALAVVRSLERGDAEAARSALRSATAARTDHLDMHGIVRRAVEELAVALARRAVAPILWFLLLGLPGVLVWLSVDILASELAPRTPGAAGRYEGFGAAAARLDGLLGWLPTRLAALIATASALFVATARPWRALRMPARDWLGTRRANDTAPLAAFAGALDLALAGPRREGEVVIRSPWIGNGRARATPADLRRALMLYRVSLLVTAGLVGATALILAA